MFLACIISCIVLCTTRGMHHTVQLRISGLECCTPYSQMPLSDIPLHSVRCDCHYKCAPRPDVRQVHRLFCDCLCYSLSAVCVRMRCTIRKIRLDVLPSHMSPSVWCRVNIHEKMYSVSQKSCPSLTGTALMAHMCFKEKTCSVNTLSRQILCFM